MKNNVRARGAFILTVVSVVALCSICFTVAAQEAPLHSSARITAIQVEQYLRDVQSFPDAECQSAIESHELTCSSMSQMTIWVFTLPGHPAHPAVVKRIMVVQGGMIGIDRSGRFAGSKPEYIRWYREFDALDRRQLEEWNKTIRGSQ